MCERLSGFNDNIISFSFCCLFDFAVRFGEMPCLEFDLVKLLEEQFLTVRLFILYYVV